MSPLFFCPTLARFVPVWTGMEWVRDIGSRYNADFNAVISELARRGVSANQRLLIRSQLETHRRSCTSGFKVVIPIWYQRLPPGQYPQVWTSQCLIYLVLAQVGPGEHVDVWLVPLVGEATQGRGDEVIQIPGPKGMG